MKISKSRTKIILVLYVGIGSIEDSLVEEYLLHLKEYTNSINDSIYTIVIPDKFSSTIRVECLNPVIISEEQYERVDNIIKEAEEKLKKL